MQKKKWKVKGILLDLDGTLVNSKKAYFEALKTAFNALKKNDFDANLILEIPKKLEQNLPINNLVKCRDIQKFLEIYLNAYNEVTISKTESIPKVSDTLKELSKKAKLALVTMRHASKENVLKELEKFGLAKYFQFVITGLNTQNPKPAPEALMKCGKHLNVPLSDCIVVGDSISDIKAGKNVGAKTVAVLSGIFSFEELTKEKPDLILENINHLLKWVR
jgi:HAD superfamily hydrolase (TIGR01509 family)